MSENQVCNKFDSFLLIIVEYKEIVEIQGNCSGAWAGGRLTMAA